ncbi:MAG: hypothetical protein AN484_27445, partial [Aphanizomenon flos-aquae WA102]
MTPSSPPRHPTFSASPLRPPRNNPYLWVRFLARPLPNAPPPPLGPAPLVLRLTSLWSLRSLEAAAAAAEIPATRPAAHPHIAAEAAPLASPAFSPRPLSIFLMLRAPWSLRVAACQMAARNRDDGEAPASLLTLLSYNTWKKADLAGLPALLRENRPHLVFLQEVSPNSSLATFAAGAGYTVHFSASPAP